MKPISADRLNFERTRETSRTSPRERETSKIEESAEAGREGFAERLEAARDGGREDARRAGDDETNEGERPRKDKSQAAPEVAVGRVELREALARLHAGLREAVTALTMDGNGNGVEATEVEATEVEATEVEATELNPAVLELQSLLTLGGASSIQKSEASPSSDLSPQAPSSRAPGVRLEREPTASSTPVSREPTASPGEKAREVSGSSDPGARVEANGTGPAREGHPHFAAEDNPGPIKLHELMRPKVEARAVIENAQAAVSSLFEVGSGDDTLEIPEPEKLDFQDMRIDLPHIRHLERGAPIESSRAIGEQITDAVQKLLADQQADGRSDLVRFRTDDGQQFMAVIRHDARGLELRLLTDDSATRNLLGDRLPEVRQALERAGLSAQVSVDRDPSRGSARRPFELPEDLPPQAPPALRKLDQVVETSSLHLIV